MPDDPNEPRPTWPPKDTFAFMAVRNQAPLLSHTGRYRLENMLHLTPSASTDRSATVQVGDQAPDFSIVRTDGERADLASFKGKPLVIRLTRAASERVV
jgi:hypothetical protein